MPFTSQNVPHQTLAVRPFVVYRTKSALGVSVVASAYTIMLGERMYPLTVLLLLVSIILTASILNRAATVFLFGLSCIFISYWVIPPLHSFQMEPRGVALFVAYSSVAIIGCAVTQLVRSAAAITTSTAPDLPVTAGGRAGFALKCDTEGSLRVASPELLRYTGRQNTGFKGFWWLDSIAYADRPHVVAAIKTGTRKNTRFRLSDASGGYHWFELSIEPHSSLLRRLTNTVILTLVEVDPKGTATR